MSLILAATALLLAAAACGGSDDDSDTERTSTEDSSGTSSADESREAGSPGNSPVDGEDSGTPQPGEDGTPGGDDGGGATETPIVVEQSAEFEPAEGEYCDTVSQSSPPNSVIGLLQIDGEDAPAGTEVMVAFDGVPGPAETTTAAGGYRVDFGVSTDDDCANKAGAEISIVIDGQAYESGVEVGQAAAFRVDVID
jgi:hypothetical protein